MNPQTPDLSLFRWIDSQTSSEDRSALLTIREAVCSIKSSYEYLEVGSHLGGSLQPHIADPRCAKIYSIDPRPGEQPDERYLGTYKYEGNSTERMIGHLLRIPDADLAKLQTFEASSWDLPPEAIPPRVQYAFVDGEHTNLAVERDFAAVRRFLAPEAVLAFHDCYVTPKALRRIRRQLGAGRTAASFMYYPASNVVAIVFESEDRIARALRERDWVPGFPAFWKASLQLKWGSRWHELKTAMKTRFPGVTRVVRRLRGNPSSSL